MFFIVHTYYSKYVSAKTKRQNKDEKGQKDMVGHLVTTRILLKSPIHGQWSVSPVPVYCMDPYRSSGVALTKTIPMFFLKDHDGEFKDMNIV